MSNLTESPDDARPRALPLITLAQHQAALAAKDQEHAEHRERQGEALRKALEDCNQLAKQLDTLLGEAVWAMTICDAYFKSGHCFPAGDAVEKVTAFLDRPDVQALTERQEKNP